MRRLVPILVLVGSLAGFLPPGAQTPDPGAAGAEEWLDQALLRAGSWDKRIDLLIDCAWPAADGDPQLAEIARDRLAHHGNRAVPGLREAIRSVERRYETQVVTTLVQNQELVQGKRSPYYLPALDEALWFGNLESKRVAIRELSRSRFSLAVLPSIDAALEYPELVPDVVEALGRIGDERARFFLGRQLTERDDEVRVKAALALARIGGRATTPLREAALSDDPARREIALNALLPVATTEDLHALYDYLSRYEDVDPKLTSHVRDTAARLEEALRALAKEEEN